MSFLLLSGVLLTLHPTSSVGEECLYPTFHHLTQVLHARETHPDNLALPPPAKAQCSDALQGIAYAAATDYEAWLGRYLPKPSHLRPLAVYVPGPDYCFSQHLMRRMLANWNHATELNYSGFITCENSFTVVWPETESMDDGETDDVAFDPAQLRVEKTSSTHPETDDVVTDAASDDETVQMDGGTAASNVFSVMNATIPTSSAPAPTWKPLLTQQAQGQHFIFPLKSEPFVTSPYGMRYHPIIHSFMRHEGVDLRASTNSDVLAIADGMVVETGYGPVTGIYMTIHHADGWSSRYLHLNKMLYVKNQYVKKGDIIALSGSTGRTDGPHLHLEIGHDNQLLDPMTLLFDRLDPEAERRAAHADDIAAPAPVPEPVDMTPTIAVVAGEGETLQFGVRIGRKMAMYSLQEIVETDDGNWRIVKKFGKYKLQKVQSSDVNAKK
jgi:murein DD-endopeptidase MepM/ murein hydrolase activator NlpD